MVGQKAENEPASGAGVVVATPVGGCADDGVTLAVAPQAASAWTARRTTSIRHTAPRMVSAFLM